MSVLSVFKADINTEISRADISESITFTPASGAAVSTYAIVQIASDQGAVTGGVGSVAQFVISRAAVADPNIYDSITYDGNTYTVRQVISGDGAVWTLLCERLRKQLPDGMS
jgi:hypothetical protein